MARWFPPVQIGTIAPYSEQKVAKQLQALDDGWTVLHSYSWLRRVHETGPLREGEADFVLFHRQHGLLVLEVKGAEVHYDNQTGEWSQGRAGNYHLLSDPVKQVQKNLHAILEQIGRRHFPHAFALVFPDHNFHGTPPGAHPSIIVGEQDLPRLPELAVKILQLHANSSFAGLSKSEGDAILKSLQSRFNLVPSLRAGIRDEKEQLIQLTEQQVGLLACLCQQPRIQVQGIAGSGKTLLAIQRVLQSVEQGRQTLFLCYNKNLANEVRQHLSHPLCTVIHYHELLFKLCEEAGLAFTIPKESPELFWEEESANLALQALERLPHKRWNSLVVDEGQDFREAWWVVVLSLLQNESDDPVALFYDPLQNIYTSQVATPLALTPFVLNTNCRNTQTIFSMQRPFAPADARLALHAPAGTPVDLLVAESDLQAIDQVRSTLTKWKELEQRQIAVLSPYSLERSIAKQLKQQLTTNLEEWRSNKAPLFSTVKGFKGLEADAVLLVDLPDRQSKALTAPEVYVALSRARHLLTIQSRNLETHQWLEQLRTTPSLK